MYSRSLFVLAAACAVHTALAVKEAPDALKFNVMDWDQVEKAGAHSIDLETRDFTAENPHVEQAVLDESERETGEFERDRASFLKQMVDLKEKAFSQISQGRVHDPKTKFSPQLRKIRLD